MSRFTIISIALLVLLGCNESQTNTAQAETTTPAQATVSQTAPAQATVVSTDLASVKQRLQAAMPNIQIGDVKETPFAGMYEVSYNGYMLYMSGDGQYIFQGDIIDRPTSRNLTKLGVLQSIDDSDTIVFAPKKKTEYTVTVFTDVDCGYCRKLHTEVPKLTENGVKVRYMLYPRAGPDSQSARTLESIWCAKNPQEALTIAKSGGSIPDKRCENPMNEHMSLAHRLGLQGTPFMLTIVDNNPVVVNGYMPADQLLQNLRAGSPRGVAQN